MDFSDQTTANIASSAPFPTANQSKLRPRRSRLAGCLLLCTVFVAGVIITLAGVFGYLLFFAGGAPQPVASSSSGSTEAILVETKTGYMTQVVQKNITASASSLPGQISNARVSFTHNGPMVISADLQFNILGLVGVTRQLSLSLQPYISACELHMHVVQADLQGFPITVFVQAFEGQINNQMQMKVAGLPPGFTYCVTNVHTEPDGLYLTYSATPQ